MDVQLPKVSGIEATRTLRDEAATAETPIIAITGTIRTRRAEPRDAQLATGLHQRSALPGSGIVGAVTILFWASLLFYLPPIEVTDGMRALIDEVRSARTYLGEQDQSQGEIEAQLRRSLRRAAAKSLAIIALGIISGVLLIWRRKKAGALLAVGLSSVMLILRVATLAQSYPHILERLNVLFTIVLPLYPIRVVHDEIIGTLFFIATIVFFTRRGFWRTGDRTQHT